MLQLKPIPPKDDHWTENNLAALEVYWCCDFCNSGYLTLNYRVFEKYRGKWFPSIRVVFCSEVCLNMYVLTYGDADSHNDIPWNPKRKL